MKIVSFKRLPSTQLYLKELVKTSQVELPLAIVADIQTAGIGSRDNSWVSQEGNLFVSFAISLEELPSDLHLSSISIYFSYILKESLVAFGSKAVLKWPNDLYLDEKKIAGMITTIEGSTLICGVGLNMSVSPQGFTSLDIELSKKKLLENYFANIEKKPLWKQIFSKYKLEFQTNNNLQTNINAKKILLSETMLQDDGSLIINGQKVYSLR